jgi:hypothetical protein
LYRMEDQNDKNFKDAAASSEAITKRVPAQVCRNS